MNARDVVKLAASRIQSSAEARSWLANDETGSWEREAQAWIDRTAEQRQKEGISDEKAALEFAHRLAFQALSAVLEAEKNTRKRRR